jgi:hypothetical protein
MLSGQDGKGRDVSDPFALEIEFWWRHGGCVYTWLLHHRGHGRLLLFTHATLEEAMSDAWMSNCYGMVAVEMKMQCTAGSRNNTSDRQCWTLDAFKNRAAHAAGNFERGELNIVTPQRLREHHHNRDHAAGKVAEAQIAFHSLLMKANRADQIPYEEISSAE